MPLDEFELYVQRYEDGEGVGFPVETLQTVFGSQLELLVEEEYSVYWKVKYDHAERCRFLIFRFPPQVTLIRILAVQNPCRDPRLWDSLHALLGMGNFGLFFTAPHFWKQKNFLIVADSADVAHFRVAPHAIRRVSDGEGICRELETA